MKAILIREFGIPEVMKYEEIEKPVVTDGTVLVRVYAAGVNPVDTYVRSGNYSVKPDLPYTPGSDAAGIVEAAGKGVSCCKPGDRVYTSGSITGTYAEYALCEESQVHPLHGRASFAQGAAIGVPYATAYRALFEKARVAPGETVLVHGGTGGVGIASVQIARNAGLTVIATGGTDRGRKLLGEQGASLVLDHRSEGYLRKALDFAGSKGINVILEMLANVNLEHDMQIVARRGRIVVIGNRGEIRINPRDLMLTEASITGMMLRNAEQSELLSIHEALVAGLSDGSIAPIIGKELSLTEAVQAHRSVMEPGAYGKIVLVP